MKYAQIISLPTKPNLSGLTLWAYYPGSTFQAYFGFATKCVQKKLIDGKAKFSENHFSQKISEVRFG